MTGTGYPLAPPPPVTTMEWVGLHVADAEAARSTTKIGYTDVKTLKQVPKYRTLAG